LIIKEVRRAVSLSVLRIIFNKVEIDQ